MLLQAGTISDGGRDLDRVVKMIGDQRGLGSATQASAPRPSRPTLGTGPSFERRLSALTTVAEVDPGQELASFCGELTERMARLVRARKVLFSVVVDGMMMVQPHPYGFGDEVSSLAVPCTPEGTGFADDIVYHDLVFRGAISDDPAFHSYQYVLQVMQVSNAIAVGVAAGSERIGLLAAFDSERKGGFTDDDVDSLRIAAAAAGLVWRHKRTADERVRLHGEASALNDAMRSMVNMMVHELRSPLSVVKGYLSMVSDATFGPVPISMLKPLRTMRERLQEALTLVDDLLLSARLESGAAKSNPQGFDLAELASSVVERETGKAQLSGGRVALEKPPDPVPVMADPKHIGIIVDNLVRNALSYSGASPQVRVCVSGEPEPTIMVIDQGKGIPPEAQARIFERFYRVTDRSSPSGTGLGLYLSRQLAELEAGKLDLEWSEEGRGSAFALRLRAASNE